MKLSALSLRNAAMTAVGAVLCAGTAFAATPSGSAQDRYAAERAACESGRSGQDRATCLREVGAARQERQRNNLNNVQSDAQLRANAAARCDRLPPERREGCMALRGDNVQVQGSVPGGAVLRQTTIREVGEPRPMPAPGMNQPGMAPAPGAAQPMPAPGMAPAPMPAPGMAPPPAPMPAPGAARPMPAPQPAYPSTQPMPAPGAQPMPAPGMNAPAPQPMPQGTTAPYGTGSGMGSGTGMR